ncbi:DMT family transporter [Tritonibacter scottomollicae]|uniref:Drug/metabolite transporter (DMT)-like permease n=1 Tax=Tritonibacter scottomollicae TaxID=483013 RepID=A0A2T1AEH9_TRISK|nr:DMT family transporter [Tritonibacter scottomollicae]PRZ46981.1 drug/metabolite transporter (DMT)-like permease [Tritonibacter scottomollicae]
MALRDWAIIVILGIGWGMSFMFNAVLLRELDPLWISTGRVGLGALGCWIFLLARGRRWRIPMSRALALAGFGALSYAIPFSFYAIGQQHIASGVAGIVNASTPALAVVVTHFWPGGERASWRKSLGVGAGLAGIVILSLPILQSGEPSAIWAVLVTLGAPLCYAFSVNVARQFRDMEAVVLVAWALSGATVFILPLAIWSEGLPGALSAQAWGALAIIGFALTSAAFIAMYWVLPRVGPTNITLPTLIAPTSALTLGVLVLGEPLALSHLMGLAAILFGLLLIDGRLFRRRPVPA